MRLSWALSLRLLDPSLTLPSVYQRWVKYSGKDNDIVINDCISEVYALLLTVHFLATKKILKGKISWENASLFLLLQSLGSVFVPSILSLSYYLYLFLCTFGWPFFTGGSSLCSWSLVFDKDLVSTGQEVKDRRDRKDVSFKRSESLFPYLYFLIYRMIRPKELFISWVFIGSLAPLYLYFHLFLWVFCIL